MNPVDRQRHLVARALTGDIDALRACVELPPAWIEAQRLAPAVARRAQDASIEHPHVDIWQRVRRMTVGRQMVLETSLQQVSEALAESNISWIPFKGTDLAERLYDRAEERPYADIDVLIQNADLDTARQALIKAGWRGLWNTPRSERYLQDEGYAWQAVDSRQVLLELHFRLWGWIPEGTLAPLLQHSHPWPERGPTARRLHLADAFILAAVHAWQDGPPRALGRFWEVERCAANLTSTDLELVLKTCRDFDIQLPVALATRAVTALWPSDFCSRVTRRLEVKLRRSERRLLRSDARLMDLPLSRIVAARLWARRRSRMGLRSIWRQIWPHPATVEQGTSPEHGPLRRRLEFQRRSWFGPHGLRRFLRRT